MTRRGNARKRISDPSSSTVPPPRHLRHLRLEEFMSKNPLEKFDYRIECDDFLIYELGRLIEEDRASFDDEEFRRVIDAGIHEHIERRLDVRANMALRLRTDGALRDRLLRTIEDIESPPVSTNPLLSVEHWSPIVELDRDRSGD